MDQFTRRIIGFGVHTGDVDGVTLCRLFNNAIASKGIPQRLSSDNDPLFHYHQWQANLRILDIKEIKSIPYTPTSHPFVERLIGTVRREYLDHLFFWNASDLERKHADFEHYYKQNRVHQSKNRRLCRQIIIRRFNSHGSLTIHGIRTARGFFIVQLPPELVIRHARLSVSF